MKPVKHISNFELRAAGLRFCPGCKTEPWGSEWITESGEFTPTETVE